MKLSSIIDFQMIVVKFVYFLRGVLLGTCPIYMNPFFISIGLSKSQAGIINGVPFIVSTVSGPLWGLLTDYTRRRSLILATICLTSALCMGSLPIAGNVLSNHLNRTQYNQTNGVSTDSTLQMETNDLFYWFLLIMSVGAVFYGSLFFQIDAIAVCAIKTSSREASYGAQRVFGSIGTFAGYYLTGFLLDQLQFDRMSPYSAAFFLYVPIVIMLIPSCCALIRQHERKCVKKSSDVSKEIGEWQDKEGESLCSDTPEDPSITSLLWKLFQELDFIVFMTTALITGLAFNLFLYFTLFLTKDVMNVSKSQISSIYSINAITSIIMFPLTGKVIKLLRGPVPAIIIGTFAHCIRHVVMSFSKTYWIMLLIQILHLLDFSLLWTAMIERMHILSPKGLKTTMTIVLCSVHYALSSFLVNMLGGILYEIFGGPWLFFGNGLLCGVWSAVLLIYHGLGRWRRSHTLNSTTS